VAITPNIAVSQSPITPQNITVTDDSTGTDVLIASRRLFIQDCFGNYIVPSGTTTNYITWSYAQSSITLSNILTQDTAASITVHWLDAANAILYQFDSTYPLSQFGKQFFYYLIQLQGLQPSIYQDINYAKSISDFWVYIKAGDNAVTFGNDIAAGQNAYNKEIYMKDNQTIFFT
jgi:hypothetical protein